MYISKIHKRAADILKDPVVKWQFDREGTAYVPGDYSAIFGGVVPPNPRTVNKLEEDLLQAKVNRDYRIARAKQKEKHNNWVRSYWKNYLERNKALADRWNTEGVKLPIDDWEKYWSGADEMSKAGIDDIKNIVIDRPIINRLLIDDTRREIQNRRRTQFKQHVARMRQLSADKRVLPNLTPYPNTSVSTVIANAETPVDSLRTSKL